MNVLLINPPNRYHDKNRREAFFPIGLGYIAGSLLEDGHKVTILDIHALNLSDQDVIQFIADSKWDVVGISAMSTQFNYVK